MPLPKQYWHTAGCSVANGCSSVEGISSGKALPSGTAKSGWILALSDDIRRETLIISRLLFDVYRGDSGRFFHGSIGLPIARRGAADYSTPSEDCKGVHRAPRKPSVPDLLQCSPRSSGQRKPPPR